MLASLENLRDHRPETNLMIRKVKILKEGCPQTNQKPEGKNPDIQVQIFKRNVMMKPKAYIATMMKTRYERKNSVQNSGRGAPEWARAMMEYLRKSTISVRRTCEVHSLSSGKVTAAPVLKSVPSQFSLLSSKLQSRCTLTRQFSPKVAHKGRHKEKITAIYCL